MLAARFAAACAAVTLSGGPGLARSQTFEAHAGPFTLRASTVGSESISKETAAAHGIERSPTTALVNATLMRDGKTVPARMEVEARNLAGMKRTIDMRETARDGYVSYMGSYDIAPGEVLDFTVKALPASGARWITLHFRDRMWGGKAP
jgi:hypothetical protein